MKTRALLPAIAACFAVAACSEKAAEPPKPQAAAVVPVPPEAPKAPAASANQDAKAATVTKGCKKGNCKVKLTVATGADGNCTAVAKDPDPRGVWKGESANPQRDVDIVWEIVSSGPWVFDAKGVDFGSNSQFNNPQPDASKKKFTWTDKNDDSGTHAYSINLVDPQSGKKCNRDPSVVNDTPDQD
jgi:hypothetical protein